ncbi:hypothetical protein SprV_0702310400 [Sparganum proliferum]
MVKTMLSSRSCGSRRLPQKEESSASTSSRWPRSEDRVSLKAALSTMLSASKIPALPTRIPRTGQTRRTPSGTIHQQLGIVNFSFHEHPCYHPCRKPRNETIPFTGDPTADAPLPSIFATTHPAPIPASVTATNSAKTTTSRTPPTDGTTSDISSSSIITINTPKSSDVDSVPTCPHDDRTFTSRIGLVGHLKIHYTEAGEPVAGALIYTRRILLHCPHCPRTLIHRMDL